MGTVFNRGTKDNPNWYVGYRENGRWVYKASRQPTKALAKRWVQEIESRIARGQVGIEDDDDAPQFKALFQLFLDGLTNRNADDDRSRGKRHLAPKFDRKPLADIDLAAVMEWIDEQRAEGELSDASIRHNMNLLSRFFSWAIARGKASINPVRQIPMGSRPTPLERQARIMDRHGLAITSQTLWDLANALAHRLASIDAALFDHVLAQPVIGLDQTGWPRLDVRGAKKWQMWCLTAPGVVVHRIRDDKSAATFKELVGGYRGTIVCDDLGTHEAGAREGPGIVLANCWAHVYRRFEEAMPDHPDAEKACAWIGMLYEIDRKAEGDPVHLAELRRSESVRVLDELKDWLSSIVTLTSLSIGKAAAYTLGNWPKLIRFIDDARIPLDNNQTERGIRGPVVGRRNHFGSKSRRGTEVAATLYTIVETAKLHDIDPAVYLHAAIVAADRGELLMPAQFTRR